MKKIFKRAAACLLALSLMVYGQASFCGNPKSGQISAAAEGSLSEYRTESLNEEASINISLLNSINIGEANADGGVAEIIAYNADTSTAYTVNGQDGRLYCFSLTAEGLETSGYIDVEEMIEESAKGFVYGDLTSVAVDTVNDHIALAVQSDNYDENGRVVLLDYDMNLIAVFETGVQPDMVTFTKDGSVILTADEGEPRNGYGSGCTDPAGTVTIINLASETVTRVGFEDFSSEDLSEKGILLGIVDGEVLSPEFDLEPEYIAVSSDGATAYVSLQEANAIAFIDIAEGKVTAVESLGFKDMGLEENSIDLLEDDQYSPDTYSGVYGVYMPDTITTYEVDGTTYILTANEGDAREWGSYSNETKVTLTSDNGMTAKSVRALNPEYTLLPDENTYIYGGRSFSIYKVDTLTCGITLVYDSANDFEEYTALYLSDWFNCSNDDVEIDSRSRKKGPEPEGIAIGSIGDRTYAFIGLERVGGIMMYDITNPDDSAYVNYINTRDFSDDIAGDVSPEGLAFVSLSDGTPVLLAAYEVSGNVAAYSFSGDDYDLVPVSEEICEPYTVVEHHYEIADNDDGSITYSCSFCGDTYTEYPVEEDLAAEEDVSTGSNTGSSETSVASGTDSLETAKNSEKKLGKVKIKNSTKSGAKRRLTVKWKKIKGADSYQLKYKKKGSKKWKYITVTGSKNKKVLKKLESGEKYKVKVRACAASDDEIYYGKWSKVKVAKIK